MSKFSITLVLSSGVTVFASSDRDDPGFRLVYHMSYICSTPSRTHPVTLFPQYLPRLCGVMTMCAVAVVVSGIVGGVLMTAAACRSTDMGDGDS